MTQLTENFTEEELIHSDIAVEHNIIAQNSPSDFVKSNLKALCVNVLQPFRNAINLAVNVSSGWRCTETNSLAGGEWNSQHLTGKAADIEVNGMTIQEVYDFFANGKIAFDQLIIEHDNNNDYWVHVSFDPLKTTQRGECYKGVKNANGGTSCVLDKIVKF